MSPAAPHSTNASRDLGNRVAEELAAGLFSGRYRPGEMLPKETELCDAFGMSRPSVRNGLQTLASLGIVRRISGRGTVVEEFREWNMLDPLVTRWMAEYAQPNPGFLAEIFEFRHATEPLIARLAAAKATARDLLAMEEAFHGMESALDGAEAGEEWDRIAFSDHDVAFHAAIYRATHNLVWAQLAHILRPAITLVVRTSNETAEELRDSLGRHRHLMECIRLRQPADAEEAARRVMARTAFDLGMSPDPESGAGRSASSVDASPKKPAPNNRA